MAPQAYCTPRSEWWMRLRAQDCGRRAPWSSASIARLASRWSAIAQPMTLREKASRIDRQIDEALGQPHIGDVGDPDLIEAGGNEAARQVGRRWRSRAGYRGGRDEGLGALAREDCPRASVCSTRLALTIRPWRLKLLGDAAIAVAAVVECDALDEVAQVGVVALGRGARNADSSRRATRRPTRTGAGRWRRP